VSKLRILFHLWISVVVFFALVAPPSAEPGLALALAGVDVAGLGGRAHGVAVAVLATFPAGDLPMIGDTAKQK
jgi:hypothetical protein